MQPQQPYQQPGMPQPGQTPQGQYDFILNPQTPKKKAPFSFGGGPLLTRILAIVGGVFVLAIVLAVIVNMSGSKFDKTVMLEVAQDQTEIIRLVEIGEKNSFSPSVKNFNAVAAISMPTDQSALISYIASNGASVKAEELVLKKDVQTDKKLESAVASGAFERTYKDTMNEQLNQYQADLASAYKIAGSKGKAVLEKLFNNAKLLRSQLAD